MNRYVVCVVGTLLGAGCEDRMKSSEPTRAGAGEMPMAVPSTQARAPTEQAEPDNTRKNERDRGDSVTPLDQGNSTAETDITANIRKGMMAEPSLSFTAKNVKVVTSGTRVTLRGPVMNAAEKTLIAAVATRTTGVSAVDNQLEVKQ
jgi:osmotically-inducible protein OsmY